MQASIEQAIEAHKAGKLQEAEALYRAILLHEPNHSDANHNLGILALSVKNFGAALQLLKTALEINPSQGQYWLSYINALISDQQFEVAQSVLAQGKKIGLVGDQVSDIEKKLNAIVSSSSIQKTTNDQLLIPLELRELGEYKKAQGWLISYVENNQDDAEAWSLLSQVLLLDKQEEASERALTTAASINPDLTSVSRNQARLLMRQAKPADALVRANAAYVREQEEPENLVVLASCLAANQRDEDALKLIDKALIARPNYAEAYVSRALIRLRGGDMPSVISDLEVALSLKPHLGQIWELLGSVRFRNKDLLGAIKALQKVEELEPTNVNNMVLLGELYRQAGKFTDSISILERATALDPGNANAWTNLGTTLQQIGNIDKARFAYKKSLAINPDSAEISSNLGAIEKDTGNWESALKYFQHAVRINPQFAEAYSNLGSTLYELGRLEDAEMCQRQAIEINPNLPQGHSNLGNTLQELGRLEEAEASYRRSIELNPNHTAAVCNLALLCIAFNRMEEAFTLLRKVTEMNHEYFNFKATVNILVLAFLSNDLKLTRLLIDKSQGILQNKYQLLMNEVMYHAFMSQLIDWHMLNKGHFQDLVCPKLHVIGESHALSSHGLFIKKFNGDFECKSHWIVGCKQWHLGSSRPNKYKVKLELVIQSLPDKANVMLSVGEIDCRLGEGIHRHAKKHTEKTLSEIIVTTIENYLRYVEKITSPKSIHVVIQGVPCPNIDPSRVEANELSQLVNLIKEFNSVLSENSKQLGFEFLDLHKLTDRGDGFSNGVWNIDQYHLSPAGMIEAWQRHLGSHAVE